MSHIKFGILGAADIAKRYTAEAICKSERTKLGGIASRDIERATEMASMFNTKMYLNYEELISDKSIDAIYIPLPIGIHAKWATMALENGKHVWCEKSLTGNLNDASKLIELAREKNLVLVENFMCEHHNQNIFVKEKIASGEIGKLNNLSLAFGFPPFKESDLKYNKTLDGGALNDAGAYCIDMMSFYLKSKPKCLWANFSTHDKEVDISGNITILHEDELVSNHSFGFMHDYKNEARFWGEKGTIVIDRCFSIPPERKPSVQLIKNTVSSFYEIEACNHFQRQLEDFCNLIENKKIAPVLNKILIQAVLMEAARVSNREKRIVSLEEFSQWKACTF